MVEPETVGRTAEETEMPSMIGENRLQQRIRRYLRRLIDRKRNERIVLRLDQKPGDANPVQVTDSRLRPVVIGGVAKSEARRGESIIQRLDGPQTCQIAV